MRRILLAAVVLGIVTTNVSPQAGNDKPVQAGTVRVAVVNIGAVFSGSQQNRRHDKPRWTTLDPLKSKAKKLTDEIRAWTHQLKEGKVKDEDKARYETAILKNQGELDALQKEVEIIMGKWQEDNLVRLWKEIQAGIKAYAIAHKIDLVLGYGDPRESEMLDLFPNVNRKMQAMDLGSTVPLFVAPRADITDGVIEMIHKMRRENSEAKPK